MTALFRNSYQQGFFSVFFSAGSNPLKIWETHIKDGYISRFLDPQLKVLVLDIGGNNVSTTYMVCPKGKNTLGIHLPFMVMIVKNLKKYFTFEVTIRDDCGFKRRFRVSNFQSTTKITPTCTAMPIGLSDGWNQIQFNLADFTRRAYNKQFAEVVSIKINANIRLRRIYFADRLVPEEELPNEYRLFIPLPKNREKKDLEFKENHAPQRLEEFDKIPSQSGSQTKIASKPSRESVQRVDSEQYLRTSLMKIEEVPGEDQKIEKVDNQVMKLVSKESLRSESLKVSKKAVNKSFGDQVHSYQSEEVENEEADTASANLPVIDEEPTMGTEQIEAKDKIPAEGDDMHETQSAIEEEDKGSRFEPTEDLNQNKIQEPEDFALDELKEDVIAQNN